MVYDATVYSPPPPPPDPVHDQPPPPPESQPPPQPPPPGASREEWRHWRRQQRHLYHGYWGGWYGGSWYWFFGVVLILVGGYELLGNLGLLRWIQGDVLWPLLLIALGAWILIGRARRPPPQS